MWNELFRTIFFSHETHFPEINTGMSVCEKLFLLEMIAKLPRRRRNILSIGCIVNKREIGGHNDNSCE